MKKIFPLFFVFIIVQPSKLQAQNNSFHPDDPLVQKLRRFMPEAFEQQVPAPTHATATNTEEPAAKTKAEERIYEVPFATKGNSIELIIANTTGQDINDLNLKVAGLPGWLQMDTERTFASLPAGGEVTARYVFHINENAPVGEQVNLDFNATAANGFTWAKKIRLKVAPPGKFELENNYPNPFNPATTIKYRLPAQMTVKVTIFDVLGREVAVLADGLQEAGTQTLSWDASRMASGLYFYRVVAEGQGGKRLVQNKKMMLIK